MCFYIHFCQKSGFCRIRRNIFLSKLPQKTCQYPSRFMFSRNRPLEIFSGQVAEKRQFSSFFQMAHFQALTNFRKSAIPVFENLQQRYS